MHFVKKSTPVNKASKEAIMSTCQYLYNMIERILLCVSESINKRCNIEEKNTLMQSIIVKNKNRKKYFLFLSPTQFAVKKQWLV